MLGAITLASAQTTQNDQGGTPITGGTVTLVPLNKQGAGGSAVLTQQGSGVNVRIDIPNTSGSATAAIYPGSCNSNAQPQIKGPAQALQALSNGSSQTVIPNMTVAQLVSPGHVIVVRSTPVYCGDVSTLLSPQRP